MPSPTSGKRISRRAFVKSTVGALAATIAWPVWAVPSRKTRRSRVALVENPWVVTEIGVHGKVLAEMLDEAVSIALRTRNAKEAWQRLVRKDEVVLLKFNQADADIIGTSPVLARTLIESLLSAGIRPSQIMPVEVSVDAEWAPKLSKPAWGWSSRTYDFGSGRDQLVRYLDQVAVIINVPFVKAHRIAMMSGCLKNLSHAFVRHPARYHADGCCPYIPDIVALPAVRAKLRLNLIDALRVIYQVDPRNPTVRVEAGMALIASTDPVAADTVGQDVLDKLRAEHNLPPLSPEPGTLKQHVLAAQRGLGINSLDAIDLARPLPL